MATPQVRAHFRPEFVNRVDEYIVFEPLRKQQIERIVRLQIDRVASRLAGRKMSLKLTDGAIEHLADVGYDPVYGARPVKRAIQHGLETLLAQVRPSLPARSRCPCCLVCCAAVGADAARAAGDFAGGFQRGGHHLRGCGHRRAAAARAQQKTERGRRLGGQGGQGGAGGRQQLSAAGRVRGTRVCNFVISRASFPRSNPMSL